METTFEEEILIEHNSRIQRESWERHLKEICADFGVSTQYVYQVKNKFVKEQRLK